jgi:hypothetical protein
MCGNDLPSLPNALKNRNQLLRILVRAGQAKYHDGCVERDRENLLEGDLSHFCFCTPRTEPRLPAEHSRRTKVWGHL